MQVLIDTNVILDVLLNRKDFVQNAVAEAHDYDCIITRNKNDYKKSNLKVFTWEFFPKATTINLTTNKL